MSFVENQRVAQQRFSLLHQKKDQVILIHYSCESFYDSEDGRTPRITSIACRNLGSAQTRSFSIHQVSELPKFSGVDAWDNYDNIEKELLDQFFAYVQEHVAHALWVHWNMRDINYGFQAIEHRYKVLGGTPTEIPDERKYDLARMFVARYGKRYADHPRLESIMKINNITDIGFLSGKDEAYAFKDRKFIALHQSTLRKVDVISSLLEAEISGHLKTNAKWWDVNGGSARLVWEKYIWTPAGKAVSALLIILALVEWYNPDAKHDFATWIKNIADNNTENSSK
ncbi:hypothetical protein [Roseibium litorale]|uniref:Uncharacterized protein n=1 Tax=Roseibium litorale TaxID=2803841 RepID=A0ABR9CKK1_9HYPH|nr:hypothetical protein [Roseibium litorale]MBD8891273.1 hypothetical protein [Roseibium litorale]